MEIFILEDNKFRIEWFKKTFSQHNLNIFDNVKRAELYLLDNNPDVLFLDHDLDGRAFVDSNEDNTGYKLAKSIVSFGKKYKKVYIHSMNPYGAKKMQEKLKEGRVSDEILRFPFSMLIDYYKVFDKQTMI